MAQMIPELKEMPKDMPFSEQLVYQALRDGLSDEYTVYHNVCFLKQANSKFSEGEADFLIFHPQKGLLIIEVKGGAISYEKNRWFSSNNQGKFEIKRSPFLQARNQMHFFENCIRNKVPHARYCKGYAVCFPQCMLAPSTDLPVEANSGLIIDNKNIKQGNLQKRVERIFHYWTRTKENLTQSEINTIKKRIFEPEFKLVKALEDTEEKFLQLTEQQYSLLTFLENQKRVCIEGSAGTGKTLLALEKGRRLVKQDCSVLMLCFNQRLADFLRSIESDITIMTFHELCKSWSEKADILYNVTNESGEAIDHFFTYTAPELLSESISKLDQRFDAIIVDEGQDFDECWWIPIEDLQREDGWLYIFYDQRQNVFGRNFNFPIDTPPFKLSENCRNATSINDWLKERFSGMVPSKQGAPEGFDPLIFSWKDEEEQQEHVRKQINKLCKEGNELKDMALLTPHKARNSTLFKLKDGFKDLDIHSIMGFKGMEANIIFLCDIGNNEFSSRPDLIFSGASRAKLRLFVFHSEKFDFQGIKPE
jgi:hypothetical protein